MLLERDVAALRRHVASWRGNNESVALVPTMGALHEGHLSLVRLARRHAKRVVVSVFVNPTQFAPGEDFARYPRNENLDAALLRGAGADLLYAPAIKAIYPDGFATSIKVAGLSQHWEGEVRPGHFTGVATVVSKLLSQAMPDYALFGEKDYQQLQIIRRLTRDLDLPVEIIGCPIVRDAFGLALSSRNSYLEPEQLQIARQLNVVLKDAIAALLKSERSDIDMHLHEAEARLRAIGFGGVDYLALCNPETLERVNDNIHGSRLIAAARLGSVRLLDNMAVE